MSQFHARLVAYEPLGPRLGELVHPLDWSASFPRNDVGSMTLRYSLHAASGDLVRRAMDDRGLEIALEVSKDGGTWVEPRGGRFVITSDADKPTDHLGIVTLGGQSYGWLASKQLVLDLNKLLPEGHTSQNTWPFYQQTPGSIMRQLIENPWQSENQPFELSFTASVDSKGATWPAGTVETIYVPSGEKYLDTLANRLVGAGLVDWWTEGRELVLVPTNSQSVDRSASVALHSGTDVTEAATSRNMTDAAEMVVFRGQGDVGQTITGNAPSPWGFWQTLRTDERVTVPSTALRMAQEAADGARVKTSYAYDLTSTAKALPLVDFDAGDWISASGRNGLERLRVAEVTLRSDGRQTIPSVTLSDRRAVAEVERARAVSRTEARVEQIAAPATGPATSIKATDWQATGNDWMNLDDTGFSITDPLTGTPLLTAGPAGFGVTPWDNGGGGGGGGGEVKLLGTDRITKQYEEAPGSSVKLEMIVAHIDAELVPGRVYRLELDAFQTRMGWTAGAAADASELGHLSIGAAAVTSGQGLEAWWNGGAATTFNNSSLIADRWAYTRAGASEYYTGAPYHSPSRVITVSSPGLYRVAATIQRSRDAPGTIYVTNTGTNGAKAVLMDLGPES